MRKEWNWLEILFGISEELYLRVGVEERWMGIKMMSMLRQKQLGIASFTKVCLYRRIGMREKEFVLRC